MMTDTVQICEIILLNKQAPRFEWAKIPVSSGRRRVFFTSRAQAAHLPQNAPVRIVSDDTFNPEGLLELVHQELSDGETPLVATNDEYLVPICRQMQAQIARYPSSDLTPFRDKRVMKTCIREARLRTPRAIDIPDDWQGDINPFVRRASDDIGFPLVAKPASEANSRGVTVIENRMALRNWLLVNKTGKGALLEEHIKGRLFFCDTMIDAKGSRDVLMICEYANPPHLFSEGMAHGSLTLPQDDPLFQRIAKFNLEALAALPEILSTITHLEVFLTPNDELVFLEVAARAPGAWVARIGERHIGINLEELNFRLQLRLPYEVAESALDYAAWLWFPMKTGTVARLNQPEIAIQDRLEWTVQEGEYCQKPSSDGPNLPENAVCRVEFWDKEAHVVKKHFRRLIGFEPVTYYSLPEVS